MAAISNYLEGKLLDHTLAGVPYVAPPTKYVALHTASPGEAGDTTTEVTGGDYERALAQFRAAAGGAAVNDNALAFTNMPGVVVTHLSIWDGNTAAANMLYHGALASPVTVTAGGTFVINATGLSVALD